MTPINSSTLPEGRGFPGIPLAHPHDSPNEGVLVNRPLVFALAFIQLVTLSGSAAVEKSLASHWRDSGVTIDALEFSKDCSMKLLEFRKCVAGVDALARNLKPAERVLPAKAVGDKAVKQGAVTRTVGELVLVKVVEEADAKVNLRLSVKAAKEDVRRNDDLVRALYESGAQVDFAKLQRELIARLKAIPENKERLSLIAGMVENTVIQVEDAHASLQPESSVEEQRQAPDRAFYGIGVMLETVGQHTIVGKLHVGGPAHSQKKLKKNDVILAVDGVSVVGKDTSGVADLIRAEEIKNVTLHIRRGNEEMDVVILRGKVETKNVETRVVSDLGVKYGYLKLASFMDERGCNKIAEGMRAMEKQGVRAFIMDVRANGGGLLSQGLCLGGLFLGEKIVAGVKNLGTDRMEWLRAQPQAGKFFVTQETKLPVVLLIDGGSASASEILAGALQDAERAWLVGETSFGKATVQSLRSDERPGVRAIIGETTARFYQPSGRTNQVVGIQPDFTVPFKPDASEDERFVRREGDIFLNALPPEGARWKQTRPSQVAAITTCVAKDKKAEKLFAATNSDENEVDYQLLAAQEILGCAKQ